MSSDHSTLPDVITFTQLVADRLHWPISERLRNGNFKVSIIKRCWEDQLLLKSILQTLFYGV
jgi:hypothetical protein